ncbi:gamma-glutamyltransferase [Methylocaldum marinum]|uniref:Gamma-glutamyltransferase n=1 Tax=Methylocaldum marinum TaxID=1432792 RepID=A0A250L046_9GAMM|nr:gamma-glutamyltransferase [Methylocaldum marinum]
MFLHDFVGDLGDVNHVGEIKFHEVPGQYLRRFCWRVDVLVRRSDRNSAKISLENVYCCLQLRGRNEWYTLTQVTIVNNVGIC